MDKIYCLVGPSGSGKTTVAKALEKDYNVIQSYTTRPPREENEWGHTFIENYPHEHVPKTIAYNSFNGYEYWATDEQYLGKGKSIYIIDPDGDAFLRSYVSCPVETIFLRIGCDSALHRIKKTRGLAAVGRVAHDGKIFACVKTDWVVDAEQGVKQVIENVRAIIEGE